MIVGLLNGLMCLCLINTLQGFLSVLQYGWVGCLNPRAVAALDECWLHPTPVIFASHSQRRIAAPFAGTTNLHLETSFSPARLFKFSMRPLRYPWFSSYWNQWPELLALRKATPPNLPTMYTMSHETKYEMTSGMDFTIPIVDTHM